MNRPFDRSRLAAVAVLATALAAGLGASTAPAQDKPVELKLAHWVPPTHPLTRIGYEPWARSVEAASKGGIKVTIYPAQQLGKAPDHYDMARDGVAELAFVNPGYQAGRFPIFAAGELPLLVGAADRGSAALDAWYRKYAEREMKDVKFCFAHLHVGTWHAKDRAITDPAQVRGLKVRPANGTVAQMVSLLGGTSVQVSAPEARDALEKGVADAITFPWTSILTFGIDRVAKHHTDMRLYQAAFAWVLNRDWYERLSPELRKVIDDHCSNEWAAKVGAWGTDEDAGREKLKAMAGHTIVPMTPQQIEAWRKAVEPLYGQWMQAAGKAGIDAAAALQELRAELKKRDALY